LLARFWRRCARGLGGAAIVKLAVALLLGGLLVLHAGPSRAADAKTVGDTVDRVYKSGHYQTEMPEIRPPDIPEFHPWTLSAGLLRLLKVVFWVLAAVGGILLFVYLANALPSLSARWRGRGRKDAAATGTAIVVDLDRERLGNVLAEADRLAREGAFGEALHLILLHCLNELRQRLGLGVPASLTSREILRLAPLPEARRSALSIIVGAVEISYFGGRPVDEATYRLCRQRCEDVILSAAPS